MRKFRFIELIALTANHILTDKPEFEEMEKPAAVRLVFGILLMQLGEHIDVMLSQLLGTAGAEAGGIAAVAAVLPAKLAGYIALTGVGAGRFL